MHINNFPYFLPSLLVDGILLQCHVALTFSVIQIGSKFLLHSRRSMNALNGKHQEKNNSANRDNCQINAVHLPAKSST